MSDPTVRRLRVEISYTASDGFRYETSIGTHLPLREKQAEPSEVFAESARELARLAALFGYAAVVDAAVKESFKAVADWKATR